MRYDGPAIENRCLHTILDSPDHRSLKQFCGVEYAQYRSAIAQRNHIGFAFLRLEYHRLQSGISYYEAKTCIVRDAIRAYLSRPLYTLPSTA